LWIFHTTFVSWSAIASALGKMQRPEKQLSTAYNMLHGKHVYILGEYYLEYM